MKCKACGNYNERDCTYCINCGSVLKKGLREKLDDFTYLNTRASRIIFLIILSVFIFSVAIVSNRIATRDLRAFIESYRSGNVAKTMEIYKKHKENSGFETTINQFFYGEADRIEQGFLKEKISKDEAVAQFNNMLQYDFLGGSINRTREKIIKIETSRTCFKQGNEKLKNREYIAGIEFLKNVVKEDPKYKEAQKLIKDNMEGLRGEFIDKEMKCYREKDYEGALKWSDKAFIYFPEDKVFEQNYLLFKQEMKKQDGSMTEKEQKEYNIAVEKLKQEQIMSVVSIDMDKDEENMLIVVLKNDSKKTIKSYRMGVYTFKEDGQPTCYGDNFVFVENGDKMSVKPQETIGKNHYWQVPKGTVKVKVCVESVVFEDGTRWSSKYYSYWAYDEEDKY